MVTALPRSAPADQGVDSRRLLAFVEALEHGGHDPHSVMVLRHGHVVAEGWWAPYAPATTSLLYSLSKSFAATAVGIAVGEGRFGLDDLVADLLPRSLPRPRPAHLASFRVRHLLAMASGHAHDTAATFLAEGVADPVAAFLDIEPEHAPGSFFAYNQGCTMALSAIVTATTGQRLVEYLRPRLLDPLGIDDAQWLQLRGGTDQGFSGLHVTTESIAKLGQLLLDGGRWQGRQLVPAGYVAEMTRRHVDNAHHSDDPDWRQGYGFQTWICTHGAVRGDGAFGQLCVLLPDVDAVVVVTAQTLDMQGELDLVWEHVLPAMAATSPTADGRLQARLRQLSTPTIRAMSRGPGYPVDLLMSGRGDRYRAAIVGASVDGQVLTVHTERAEHRFNLPVTGGWARGSLPGLHTRLADVAVTGGWVSDDAFDADVVFVRTPHRLRLAVRTEPTPVLRSRWHLPPL